MNNNKIITQIIQNNKTEITLGKRTSLSYLSDPSRLAFTLSRYKFVSRMLEDFDDVLEIGAGDGFKAPIVKQFCNKLTLSDITVENKRNFEKTKTINANFLLHDFTKKKLKKKFDGIYFLDVFEHIDKKIEIKFIKNICHSLKKRGVLICGMPSLVSQKYASKLSRLGHVNCKDKKQLKKFFLKFFNNVFMFSMNDEVLHTGYDKMSHYILAVCCNKK